MIEVGDKVKYYGSLAYYHKFDFIVVELFEYCDVQYAMLQGPEMDIWIERCRVSKLTLVEKRKNNDCNSSSSLP
jgi:hypothetical protein